MNWISGDPTSEIYKDIYFSKNQAVEESNYVYIQGNKLLPRWRSLGKYKTFNIGELGFGAGINFLVTLKNWTKYSNFSNHLNYFSIDNRPLALEDLRRILQKYPELKSFSTPFIRKYPVNCKGIQRIEF